MRIFLKIIAVMILSACFSGMLFYTGLLHLGREDVTQKPEGNKTADPNAQSNAEKTETTEKLDSDKVIQGNSGEKGKNNRKAGEKSPSRLEDNYGPIIPIEQFAFILDTDIYHRSRSYLAFLAGDKNGNIERRFSTFLASEFNLSEKEIDIMLRMVFWKNFLVLRHWPPDEAKNLQLAFDRELSLKKSGFQARGLQLMTTEINETRALLSKILENERQGEEKWVESQEDGQ